MDFSPILDNMLKELNLTQTQFAKLVGVKQSQVSEWLSGKAKPGYDTLRAMVLSTGFSAAYLLGFED